MKQIIIRTLNLLLIVGVLFSYQYYAVERYHLVTAHKKEEKEAKDLERKYQKMIQQAEEEAAKGEYKDGTYEGTGKGYGGNITLRIKVENSEISKVEVLSAKGEDSLYFNRASALIEQIEDEQTADLDGISGATYSSAGILEAADNALEGARNE